MNWKINPKPLITKRTLVSWLAFYWKRGRSASKPDFKEDKTTTISDKNDENKGNTVPVKPAAISPIIMSHKYRLL